MEPGELAGQAIRCQVRLTARGQAIAARVWLAGKSALSRTTFARQWTARQTTAEPAGPTTDHDQIESFRAFRLPNFETRLARDAGEFPSARRGQVRGQLTRSQR